MKTTSNFGLKMPDGTDVVDIEKLNENSAKIDTELSGVKNSVTGIENGSVTVKNAEQANNAAKVNNLTVQTAVPANAKFTDTLYTHPAAKQCSASIPTVANNLTTTAAGYALDARQGKILNDKISGAKNYVTKTFTRKTTWTVPSNVSELDVFLVGGGSGGGGGGNRQGSVTSSYGGWGGGSGYVLFREGIKVKPGQSLTIIIGGGGVGGAAATTSSSSGVSGQQGTIGGASEITELALRTKVSDSPGNGEASAGSWPNQEGAGNGETVSIYCSPLRSIFNLGAGGYGAMNYTSYGIGGTGAGNGGASVGVSNTSGSGKPGANATGYGCGGGGGGAAFGGTSYTPGKGGNGMQGVVYIGYYE